MKDFVLDIHDSFSYNDEDLLQKLINFKKIL